MEIEDIKKLIPHRYPFLFVDRVLKIENGHIEAIKNVSVNEPFFAGHFPDYPIMPGVLALEAIAQACAILLAHAEPDVRGRTPLFLGIEQARFRRPIRPGDVVTLVGEVVARKGNIWKLAGRALVGGEVATEMQFMAGFKA